MNSGRGRATATHGGSIRPARSGSRRRLASGLWCRTARSGRSSCERSRPVIPPDRLSSKRRRKAQIGRSSSAGEVPSQFHATSARSVARKKKRLQKSMASLEARERSIWGEPLRIGRGSGYLTWRRAGIRSKADLPQSLSGWPGIATRRHSEMVPRPRPTD